MSRPHPRPTPPDWQASLVEAIQQRDAPRARSLAQRCVHRQGMGTLEALLDRAEPGAGPEGGARLWLLQLLRQPPVEAEPPRTEVSPPAPTGRREPETATAPTPALPSSPVQASAAALDQAFAPLEIAFPPLPMVERKEVAPPPPAAPLPPPPLAEPPAMAEEEPQERAAPVPADAPLIDHGALRTGFEADAVAAPMPSFHVESATERHSAASQRQPQGEDPGEDKPAPVANTLAAWRAWLPGAFRSRTRS